MFHSTKDTNWLESLLRYLIRRFIIVSIEELDKYLEQEKTIKKMCLITVDDGDLSFYQHFYPLLLKYNLPATLFISPKIIKGNQNYWFQQVKRMDQNRLKKILSDRYGIKRERLDGIPAIEILKSLKIAEINEVITRYCELYDLELSPQNVSADQIVEMVTSSLVTIGAHTQNHPILANETSETAEDEVSSSISELSSLIDKPVKYFAYPNGTPGWDFGEREKRILHENGIRLAFSTRVAHLKADDDPLELPRIGLSYGSQLFIKTKLNTGYYWGTIKDFRKKFSGKRKTDYRINLLKRG
jgi:peptidoglycan/xylan/chitin deacetylase (PgdA/CDA1 family)